MQSNFCLSQRRPNSKNIGQKITYNLLQMHTAYAYEYIPSFFFKKKRKKFS